jgi:hypothetical protein
LEALLDTLGIIYRQSVLFRKAAMCPDGGVIRAAKSVDLTEEPVA